ncbi:MAG TPA: aldo/keto reductase [Terriglobia bacterium]|nr:aldo/keto reductase [Terriglobia bacterium]
MNSKQNRREFLEKVTLGVAGVGAAVSGTTVPALSSSAAPGDMPYRTLGRSGEKVSLLGLGGYHLGLQSDEQESIRIIRTAIDNGVNFMDNCWDYNDGNSEIRMGKGLRDGYRQKVFLMTKIDGQLKDIAASQIDESLRRLQTDTIDLLQFHEVIRPGDPDRIFGPGGSFEAAIAAKKAGKIRYIGFTGHKDPDIHLKMLNTAFQHSFTFDAVQMPLNVMDMHFKSFAHKVVPVLVEHGIGVLGMKSMGDGNVLKSNTVTPIECLHYAMSLPTSVVINGCESLERLEQGLQAARTFRPLSQKELDSLAARTAAAGRDGQFEPFKTTNMFDGTAHNPAWLG